jgi:hypothetical protein
VITVKERPLLLGWGVRGFDRIAEGTIRDRVKLVNGKPLDRMPGAVPRRDRFPLQEAGLLRGPGEGDHHRAAERRRAGSCSTSPKGAVWP